MKTEMLRPPITVFPRVVPVAVGRLKEHLLNQYARAYPGLDEIIRLVIDEEESRAWDLSAFPHLVLPDLVEAHLAQLGLEPAEANSDRLAGSTIVSEPLLAAAC
jgi:hypothetical protein